jgi:hypothetical protein
VPPVGWRKGLLAGALVGVGAMAAPAVASAATISQAFSPASIPLNGAATLTFTLEDPDQSLHAVSFDDTLPDGLRVVGTPTTTCGPPALATTGGPSDVAFNDAALTDPSCTVTASVQGVQSGHWDDPVPNATIDLGSAPTDAAVDVVAPPSISAAFGTTLLGLDGSTPLTFTITNPNPAFALSGVTFTNSLPAGLVIAGQPAANSCAGTLTAVTGTDSLGLSGGQLPPGATCSVSATIVATATGTLTDTTTQVLSTEGGIGNPATAALTVIGAPTITLSAPAAGHVYAFGQKVPAVFSCADDPNGPGIGSCRGTVASGALIATGQAGAHSFTVTATSLDGGVASDTVFYSVAPDNRFTVSRPHVHSDGSIDLVAKLPGPGRVTLLEKIAGARFVFAHATASARRAGKLQLTIRPTARGRRAVQHGHGLRVTTTLGYTPTGGAQRTTRIRFRIA